MGTLTANLVEQLKHDHTNDPIGRLVEVTTLIDEVRTELLPELAVLRRSAADEARQALILAGMKATEATRNLAQRVNASPQTINRLVQENRAYHVEGAGHDKEVTAVEGVEGNPGKGKGD